MEIALSLPTQNGRMQKPYSDTDLLFSHPLPSCIPNNTNGRSRYLIRPKDVRREAPFRRGFSTRVEKYYFFGLRGSSSGFSGFVVSDGFVPCPGRLRGSSSPLFGFGVTRG